MARNNIIKKYQCEIFSVLLQGANFQMGVVTFYFQFRNKGNAKENKLTQ